MCRDSVGLDPPHKNPTACGWERPGKGSVHARGDSCPCGSRLKGRKHGYLSHGFKWLSVMGLVLSFYSLPGEV